MKHTVQYRQADGSLGEMEVDLLFPGTARTVVRLMEAWWDAKASTLQTGANFAADWVKKGPLLPQETAIIWSNWVVLCQSGPFLTNKCQFLL